ncbi:MAG: class I SAM-dependent methyltransferase [Bacteroidia bacterium]|nr:class I SAM-dependent methyltransferase [Bacteroidia bacterium]
MKNYQDVINERFDTEIDNNNSIYSPIHPIGKYVRKKMFGGLNVFFNEYKIKYGELSNKKLLDIGCGDGGMIEYFLTIGFFPDKIMGIDLSSNRINKAQKRNKDVQYTLADITTLNLNERKFNLITSFDLFSHLTTKEQIIKGLSNVYNHLEDDGLFLWYDIYSKDHFLPAKDADSWGFNKEQMIYLSIELGFEIVYYKTFFKNFFNRYHSIYQVKRLSPGIVNILEAILPGMPGNIMLVFKKKNVEKEIHYITNKNN